MGLLSVDNYAKGLWLSSGLSIRAVPAIRKMLQSHTSVLPLSNSDGRSRRKTSLVEIIVSETWFYLWQLVQLVCTICEKKKETLGFAGPGTRIIITLLFICCSLRLNEDENTHCDLKVLHQGHWADEEGIAEKVFNGPFQLFLGLLEIMSTKHAIRKGRFMFHVFLGAELFPTCQRAPAHRVSTRNHFSTCKTYCSQYPAKEALSTIVRPHIMPARPVTSLRSCPLTLMGLRSYPLTL